MPNWKKLIVSGSDANLNSLDVSTSLTASNILISGSGSTLLDIQGSQGQLFSVTDSLSGSLFAVSDISGIPLLEVESNSTITMGDYGTNALVVTGSQVGIGTDTVSVGSLLEVDGRIKTKDLLIEDVAPSITLIDSDDDDDHSISFITNASNTIFALSSANDNINFTATSGRDFIFSNDSSVSLTISSSGVSYFTNDISASGDLYLDGHSINLGTNQTKITSYSSYLGIFASGGSAKDVKAKSLTLSNDFGDSAPTNGLYIKGDVSASSDFYLDGAFYDTSNQPGDVGQILSSTNTGTSWIDSDAITAASSEAVQIAVKNVSGGTLAEGTPVFATGSVGATETLEVVAADASDSTLMPAVGILTSALNNNGLGYAIVTGMHKGITTSPIDGVTPSTGDTLYVKAGGGLTTTKPTGASNFIQNIGKIGKVSGGSAGSIVVSSIMRTNDIPNLPEGKIWVGSTSYSVTSSFIHLDESNQRLGVGILNPTQDIDVAGSIKIGAGQMLTSNGSLILDIDNNNNETDRTLRVTQHNGANELFRIQENGNVGIGTANPQTKLEVAGAIHATGSHLRATNDAADSVGLSLVSPSSGVNVTFDFEVGDTNIGGLHSKNLVIRGSSGASDIAFSPSTTYPGLMMLDGSTGRVGIGTTSPTQTLDVSGSVIIRPDSTTDTISFLNLGSTQSRLVTTDNFAIWPGGSEAMRLLSNGNVGIGTGTPEVKLDVRGQLLVAGDTPDARIGSTLEVYTSGSTAELSIHQDDSSATSTFSQLRFRNGGNDTYFKVPTSTNGLIIDVEGQANALVMDTNGNTTIANDLTVEGIVTAREFHTEFVSASIIYQSGSTKFGDTSDDTHDFTGSINLEVSESNKGFRIFTAEGTQVFSVANNNSNTFPVGVMTINYGNTSGGQISGQSNALKIRGGSSSAGKIIFTNGAAGADEIARIDSNGIGVGTPSPLHNFHSQTDNDTYAYYLSNAAGSNRGGLYIDTSGNSELKLRTGDGEQVSVKADGISYFNGGKVGIGTATPKTELEVRGDINVQNKNGTNPTDAGSLYFTEAGTTWGTDIYGFRINQQGTSNYLNFQSANTTTVRDILTLGRDSGNVGIGTVSPSQRLDVVDDNPIIRIADSNSTIRYSALQLQTNGGSWYFSSGDSNAGAGVANSDLWITRNDDGTDNRFRFHRDTYAFSLYSGSNQNVVLNANGDTFFNGGDVGIGTSNPLYKLHIVGGDFLTATANGGYFQVDESDNSVKFSDNVKAKFGTSSDLEIYHDGSNSYIKDGGIGNLRIAGQSVDILNPDATEFKARFVDNDRVELYYDNNKKFETTNTGVEVTGDIVARDTYPSIYVNHGGTVMGGIRADATTKLELKTLTAAPLSFQVNSSEKMRIQNDGNVGIGTTNPNARLKVEGGDIRTDAINDYRYDTDTNFISSVSSDPSYLFSGPYSTATHDVFRFLGTQFGSGYLYNNVTQSVYDGSSWTEETLNKEVFSGNDSIATTIINDSAGEEAVRWEVNGVAYNSARWLVINHTYVGGGVEKDIHVESSGSSGWTTRHTSSYSGTAQPYLHHVTSWGGDNRLRITITKSDLTDGKNVNISGIQLLTTRKGDQGKGSEGQYPYVWDKERNIGIGNYAPGAGTLEARLSIKGTTADTTGYATVMRNGSNTSLLSVRNDGRVDIPTGNLITGQDVTVGSRLNITTVDNAASDTDKFLVLNGTEVEYRTGDEVLEDIGALTSTDLNDYVTLNTAQTISGAKTFSNNITLDDNNGDSPYLRFIDGNDNDVSLYTNTSGTLLITKIGTNGADFQFYNATDYTGSYLLAGGTSQYGSNALVSGSLTVGTGASAGQIKTNSNKNLQLLPDGNGHVYLGNAGNGMNLYHYSQQNNGAYTTFTHVGTEYTITPTATGGINLNSDTKVTGDLTVEGIVTAREFHTEFVSASIIYQSGSTKFGDTSDDTHNFTGSLQLSTGTKIFGDSTNPYLHLDQASGTHLYYGSTSGVSFQGWTTTMKADRSISLAAGGSTQLIVSSSGNVGIGVTSPEGLLQISRDSSTAYDGTNDSGQSNIGASLTIQNPNTTVNSFAQVNMQVSANSNRAVGRIVTIAKGGASSDMAFVTENAGVRGEKMRITQAGNVGIGITNPGTKLHVGTGSGATVDTGYQAVIDSAGIAGLQILSATNQSGRIVFGDSDDNDIGMIKYDHTDNSMGFRTNGSGNERMRIDQTGNVGIGTTSPAAKLDVQANGQTDLALTAGYGSQPNLIVGTNTGYTRLEIASGSYHHKFYTRTNTGASSERLRIEGGAVTANVSFLNSNVGIGTTSPQDTLHVEGNITGSGDININGTLTAAVKSFDIPHPTKEGKRLVYGVLEGPEHAVYVRGESKEDTVILPEEWIGLVDETTITVQLTPIGSPDVYYYKGYENNSIKVGGPENKNYFYYIQATRKDVDKLTTVQ